VNCENICDTSYVAFQTFDTIGVVKLPGTGHPDEYNMILAHPTGVRTFDIVFGHNLLISNGENDNCIFIWKFDSIQMEKQVAHIKLESTNYIKHLESIFYCVQLQDPQNLVLNRTIRLPLIIDFARMCGVHVSQRQIHELYDEQCFKKAMTNPEKIEINFEEAIRIYYNHFANDFNQMSADEIMKFVFNEYKSPTTSKIDIQSLIQTLVSETI